MSQLALYRKYRSADLSDVVGQAHITKTLEQSISKDRISHAYLFTGPRGVGKTSVARILARRVNKLSATEDISAHLDIIEIDAASNRGVDEMRNLREKINSAPSNLKYKVYIIDEAHMLTREAFNALLKTLEEPPAHAIFILATTEAHKLPDTIISRTQRYDFRPFRTELIVDHLRHIAKEEKISVTDDGLTAIAQLSGQGMRDAISMLDQLSVASDVVDQKAVQSYMGLSSIDQIEKILLESSKCNSDQVVDILEGLFADGTEPSALNAQIQHFLRKILLEHQDSTPISREFALKALDILLQYHPYYKLNVHPSLPLEMAIVKISQINDTQAPQLAQHPIQQPPKTANKSNLSSDVSTKSDNSKITQSKAPSPDHAPSIDISSRCAKGLSIIKEHNNSLYALLHSGNAHIEGDKLVVECRFQFHKQRIEEFRNREIIEKVMTRACKTPIQLECRLKNTKVVEKVDNEEEIVSSAMAILGGELVDG
ncbi:MAG: polymerase subunit gamma/tau [Patescibacteria group bacterium]|nr:polymerase subunit gamma/tau [Patescibacteria group bacterium]